MTPFYSKGGVCREEEAFWWEKEGNKRVWRDCRNQRWQVTAKIECLAFRTQLGSCTFECIVVVPAKAVHQLKSEKNSRKG